MRFEIVKRSALAAARAFMPFWGQVF